MDGGARTMFSLPRTGNPSCANPQMDLTAAMALSVSMPK